MAKEDTHWSKNADGIFQKESVRVILESSDDDYESVIYVDVSDVDDRQNYHGFYLTYTDLKEIMEVFGDD